MKTYIIQVNDQRYEVTVEEKGCVISGVVADPISVTAPVPANQAVAPPAIPPLSKESASGNITAPMPSKVVAVNVKAGNQVKKGQVLLVLEAMKMENEIIAPAAGTVKEVHVSEGSNVNVGEPLITII